MTMQLQSTFTQIILISLFAISSAQVSAQLGNPSDLSTGRNGNIGTGNDDPSEPLLLLPDGRTVLRDGRVIAPGEPLPVKTRKTEMKKTKPSVLKESGSGGVATRSVLKDIGGRSTQSKLTELKILHQRMLNPDKSESGTKPEVVKQRYNKLYRELDEEQRASRSKGIREPAGPVKNEILRQSREIDNILKTMPTPPKEKSKSIRGTRRAKDYADSYTEYLNLDDKLEWIDEDIFGSKSSSNYSLNSNNREEDFRYLKRLRQDQLASKADIDDVEKRLNRLLTDGKLEGAKIAKLQKQLREVIENYENFVEYINDYEKALQRKWPKDPEPAKETHSKTKTNELEVPEIGPLPGIIGEPRAPGPIDFPSA